MNFLYILVLLIYSNCAPNLEGEIVKSLSNTLYNTNSITNLNNTTIKVGEILKVIDTLNVLEEGIFKGSWYKVKYKEKDYYIPSFKTTQLRLEGDKIDLKIKKFASINDLNYEYHSEDYFYSEEVLIFKQKEIPEVYYIIKQLIRSVKLPDAINTKLNEDILKIDYNYNVKSELSFLHLSWLFEGGTIELKFERIDESNDVKVSLIEDRA